MQIPVKVTFRHMPHSDAITQVRLIPRITFGADVPSREKNRSAA
jgi:hypothetical protein